MRRTDFTSDAATFVIPRRARFSLVVFLVKMWRLNAWPHLTVPPGRTRKRFFAELLVFILGIIICPFGQPQIGTGLQVATIRCSWVPAFTCSAARLHALLTTPRLVKNGRRDFSTAWGCGGVSTTEELVKLRVFISNHYPVILAKARTHTTPAL